MGSQTSSQTSPGSRPEDHLPSSNKEIEGQATECPMKDSRTTVTPLAAASLSKHPAEKQSVSDDKCPMHGEQMTSSQCPIQGEEKINPRNMVG